MPIFINFTKTQVGNNSCYLSSDAYYMSDNFISVGHFIFVCVLLLLIPLLIPITMGKLRHSEVI